MGGLEEAPLHAEARFAWHVLMFICEVQCLFTKRVCVCVCVDMKAVLESKMPLCVMAETVGWWLLLTPLCITTLIAHASISSTSEAVT